MKGAIFMIYRHYYYESRRSWKWNHSQGNQSKATKVKAKR